MPSPARTLLLAFVSAWFLLGGLGHFVFTDFFVGIVPPYVPLAAGGGGSAGSSNCSAPPPCWCRHGAGWRRAGCSS